MEAKAMTWNEIERYLKKYPKCELCYKESVHRIERSIRIPELDCLRFKLTAPQYMKASAYFEDKPFLCDKMIDGAFQYYRRKQ
jgi:ribosomal protein L37AE/L43A